MARGVREGPGVLAVAQAPLSEDQIAAITALSPVVIRGALHKLREVLEADEGRPASQREYALYHRSLADFLLDRDRAEDYWLHDVSLHRLVAEHYLACGTDGWRACDEYGLRYLAAHLLGGREIARLQSLPDHDWIRMRYERGHYSYDGVLGDVELAWRAAEQVNRKQIAVGQTAPYLAQDVRWALIASSIGSLAAGLPPELLGALVRRGEWSALQGLVYARRVPEGEPRSKTLASLAPHLPEPLRADAFAEAVAAAGQIPDARDRAGALTRLLTMLSPEPRTQALIQAMAALRELSDRRRIASGTTGYYGGDVGERYEHTGIRTAALSELGEVLAGLNGSDAELAEQAGQLRALLEAAYGQRFTFRGEQRDPTGTRVSVTQVLGDVAGDVLGVEADVAPGASADVHQQATTVQPGGSVTGFKGNIGR